MLNKKKKYTKNIHDAINRNSILYKLYFEEIFRIFYFLIY